MKDREDYDWDLPWRKLRGWWCTYGDMAFEEGWVVVQPGWSYLPVIQVDDENPMFKSDEDAHAFVLDRASQGSKPHQELVAILVQMRFEL